MELTRGAEQYIFPVDIKSELIEEHESIEPNTEQYILPVTIGKIHLKPNLPLSLVDEYFESASVSGDIASEDIDAANVIPENMSTLFCTKPLRKCADNLVPSVSTNQNNEDKCSNIHSSEAVDVVSVNEEHSDEESAYRGTPDDVLVDEEPTDDDVGQESVIKNIRIPVGKNYKTKHSYSNKWTVSTELLYQNLQSQLADAGSSSDCKTSGTFECSQCKKTFHKARNLKKHEMIHENRAKEYKCKHCKVIFSEKRYLLVHLETHPNVTAHQCTTCGKKFISRRDLNMHVKTHLLVKCHMCNYCGKLFTTPHNLKCHIRTHTNEKPYSCNFCQIACNSKQDLLRHLRTHTGEKIHECGECGRKFTHHRTLSKHKLVHSGVRPFCCSICECSFSQKQNLEIHIKTHTHEKEFQCSYCDREFTSKRNLTSHVRMHKGGGKDFQCTECDKSFTRKTTLNNHLKQVHTLDRFSK